jgi:hypothetical protein
MSQSHLVWWFCCIFGKEKGEGQGSLVRKAITINSNSEWCPQVGFEPTTSQLTVNRSTTEPYEGGGEPLAFEPNSREHSIAWRLNCNGELSDIHWNGLHLLFQTRLILAGQDLPCNFYPILDPTALLPSFNQLHPLESTKPCQALVFANVTTRKEYRKNSWLKWF